jgi:Ca2+-binding EF-hand superfamily protein
MPRGTPLLGCAFDVTESPVTDDQLKFLFDEYDTDGSGGLDAAEFKKAYLSLEWYGMPPSDAEIARAFTRAGGTPDAGSRIAFPQFAILMLQRSLM